MKQLLAFVIGTSSLLFLETIPRAKTGAPLCRVASQSFASHFSVIVLPKQLLEHMLLQRRLQCQPIMFEE